MSTSQLEQQRLKAIQLIKDGKNLYMGGKTLEIKKKGYLVLKDGCSELFTYVKNETDEKFNKLGKEKLSLYITELQEMKTYLEEYENKNLEQQNKIQNKENSDQKITAENQVLKANLNNAIITEKPNVKWDDIAGLENAKNSLKEAVIMPTKFPELFKGVLKPWTGILLYGPPGTGKTFLAKACATECNCTFISVSSADLISKYVGDSEKSIKQLFQLAREKKPSIIFIDEIDSLASSRESSGASDNLKGVKNQLLVELSGVGTENNQILVLGATNLPWNIDSAVRRRFEKRIYIPLPDKYARLSLLQNQLSQTSNNLTQIQLRQIAEQLEGYSGSDINTLVRDASYEQFRIISKATHFKREKIGNQIQYKACLSSDLGAEKLTLKDIQSQQLIIPPTQYNDFLTVLPRCKSSVAQKDLIEYENWTQQFGQQG